MAETIRDYLFSTPASTPTAYVCRRLLIPADVDWLSIVYGALSLLTVEDYFRVSDGHLSAQDTISEILEMLLESLNGCPGTEEVTMPIGSIIAYPSMALPDNLLPCDGSMYYRVDYPDLYGVLDPQWYVDADRFWVPNLVEKMVYGAVHSTDLGDTGGETEHTLIIDEMPEHQHTMSGRTAAGTSGGVVLGNPTVTSSPRSSFVGGNQPHNNMPPFIKLNWVIVAKV